MTQTETLALASSILTAAQVQHYRKELPGKTVLIAYSHNDGLDVVEALAGTTAGVRVSPQGAPSLYQVAAL